MGSGFNLLEEATPSKNLVIGPQLSAVTAGWPSLDLRHPTESPLVEQECQEHYGEVVLYKEVPWVRNHQEESLHTSFVTVLCGKSP